MLLYVDMKRKNKYYRRSRIPEAVFETILGAFADDLTARQTEQLSGISIRSVNVIFIKLRKLIAQYCELSWESMDIDNENDIRISRTAVERQCELEGRKILVLVLNEYKGCIYLEITEDARKKRKPSNSSKVSPGYIMAGSAKQPQRNEFWLYLEQRLLKFRGIAAQTFYLHVKETEFRFNHQDHILDKLTQLLEHHPL